MSSNNLVLKNAEALLLDKNGLLKKEKVNIAIKQGKISQISQTKIEGTETLDLSGLTILPGLIDTQVHFREPGLTHKEDIESGSRSALLGGVCGFFEMPNTKPSTTTVEAMKQKLAIAEKSSWVNYAFYAGAAPENIHLISELEKLPGCSGIKVFMGSSTGSLLLDDLGLLEEVVKRTQRKFAVHCEDEKRLNERKALLEANIGNVAFHPEWRDEETAFIATANLLEISKRHGKKPHVLHITSKKEIEYLKQNKAYCSVEVTPQHLTLFAPNCYEKLGTKAQMNPPIRAKHHQEALWKGITDGTVDIIGSDHAPHTLEEKAMPFPQSPSGMTGVQTTVPVMLTHVNEGRLSLEKLIQLMCINPTLLFGIKNKGGIQIGNDADFTIVDLKREEVITKEWIQSKSGWSPFEGFRAKGWPVATILNGQLAMMEAEIQTPNKLGRPFEFQ